MLKFLMNSVDRSIIYDKDIITRLFETLSIDSVCFKASTKNIVMELLRN